MRRIVVPPGRIGASVSRHYADVAVLWAGAIGQRAMGDVDLLTTVAAEKELLYPVGGVDYLAAGQGQLRLVPPQSHVAVLRDDHRAMREMYFDEPPSFDVIQEKMKEIEVAVLTAFMG